MPWVLAGGLGGSFGHEGDDYQACRCVAQKTHHLLNHDDVMVETIWNVCV